MTVGLVSLFLVVSSCALIEGEATTTTVDEWTLNAYTDLVAFCERNKPVPRTCPFRVREARDDLNCTVEGAYLYIAIMADVQSRPMGNRTPEAHKQISDKAINEAANAYCNPLPGFGE